jgi:hypothetical protein
MIHLFKPKPWKTIIIKERNYINIIDLNLNRLVYWETINKISWGKYEYDKNGAETYYQCSSGEIRINGKCVHRSRN